MSTEDKKSTDSTINPQPAAAIREAATGETAAGAAATPEAATAAASAHADTSSSHTAVVDTTADIEIEPTVGEEAVKRIMHLLNEIPEAEVVQRINTSVRSAGVTALGAYPRIQALLADAKVKAPNHDCKYLNAFKDIAIAMIHSDTAVLMTVEEKQELAAKAGVLEEKRDKYLAMANGYAGFGLMDGRPLAIVGTESGYRPLARDNALLVAAFRQSWSKVGKLVPFTASDLAQLDRETTDFNEAVGLKEQTVEQPREATLFRRLIYTLFRKTVDDGRRLAVYVYGDDAAEELIPGLSNFKPGSRSSKAETENAATPSTDASATTKPTTGSATTKSAETKPTTAALRPSGFVVNNPDNLPITSPFSEDDDDKKRSA